MIKKNDHNQEVNAENKNGDRIRADLLSLALGLGFSIAIPIVGLALLGRAVDKWLVTSPIFLLVGIFLSMPVSVILIYRKVKNVLE